ncbi:MAG: FecR family protein [Elusimicrobiota bacterium]
MTLLLNAAPAQAGAGEYTAVISALQGTVTVESPSKSSLRKAASLRMGLRAKDIVRTGADGHAEISLSDAGLVELQPNAALVISSLDRSDATFQLRVGALLSKLRSLGKGRRLRVRTPRAVASVRGTEFGVQASTDDASAVFAVFDEGRVEVSSDNGSSVMLEPNQETEVSGSAAPATPHQIQQFLFAQQRMRILRERMRYFDGKWHKKYGIPSKKNE